jgi:hypothetical protein
MSSILEKGKNLLYANRIVELPNLIVNVLDLVSQVRDVVLMNVYLDLGDPGGSGFWHEGYMGKGREMGRSVYEQPGNEVDRILSQQGGFQVSKGSRKGSKRE